MNVFDASKRRIERIFAEFDNVYVSFSGGKDSGVLLNLAIEHARKIGRRIGVFHIDYEAQYQMTTDYVDSELEKNGDVIDAYRICLPIAAQCATSMHQAYWLPWEKAKQELWVRPMPEACINEDNHAFPWFSQGMWDYELQERFASWYHEKIGASKTACLVGIRTQESLNRWRAIHSDRNMRKFDGIEWSKEMASGVFNFYPIFDWTADDIWTANALQGWAYNRLYDLFWQAGLSVDQMRVASPFNDCAIESLKLYKVIDPANWGKMIGRTNGVNFAGLYGGTTAMGWRSIKLPPGHTWKSYMEFLLTTLPQEVAENYTKKLEVSRKFWQSKGGCLSTDVIRKLSELGVSHTVCGATNYKTDKLPVRMDYVDDIDIEEFKEIPSYKRMCVCIMKNDHLCKYMGFSATKTEAQMRSEAERKYKDL
jgi:predicted phosphoadenosine phosphosulfate sulfurtransferase